MDEEFYEARRSTLYTIKPIAKQSSNAVKSKSFSKALLESHFQFPRKPSIVPVSERPIHYVTADKTTCRDCPCFKNEAPYEKPQKIRMCQFTPRTLYELACLAVDALPYPRALTWIPQEVANWISNTLGFPQYAACFLSNSITGRKLLLFEDPSMLPHLNIVDYEHIKVISSNIRRLYGMEIIKFTRSIGLPPRKPPTHCTLFQMRTPSPNSKTLEMTKSDILRMLHIINPKPIYINHWDLVWYVKPEYPKTKFGRVKNPQRRKEPLPKHVPIRDQSYEAVVPRKYKIQSGISPDQHLIWVDTRSYPINKEEHKKDQKDKKKKKHLVKPIDTRLFPKKISSTGLTGHALALARRLQPRQKFFPKIKYLPDEVSRKSSKTSQEDNKEPVVVYQSKRM